MLALTPISAAVMGGRQSAIAELLKLIRSLGGHIFAPGLETYADQAALNPAASALDSQVGYVGSAVTQGLGENLVLESEFTTGTASAFASTWAFAGNINNVNISVVGKGVNPDGTAYQDFRIYTTAPASATTYPHIYSVATGYVISAFPGQLFAQQLKVKLVAGSFSGFTSFTHRLRFVDNASSQTDESVLSSLTTATGEYLTLTGAGRSGNANTTRVTPRILGAINAGSTCDVTIRICNWQLERGHPTNYTPTYGTAISRGVFASAAQGTLPNTPKLVTLGNARGLEFDGSTDYLGANVQTAASGYICTVIRQTADFSTSRAFLGSGSFSKPGFSLYTSTGNIIGFATNEGGTQTAAITSGGSLTVGELAVIDASYTPTGKSVRKNGAFEGTSSAASNPTTNNLLLIGGRNNGVVGAEALNTPFTGMVGITVYTPNVTLPTATEQRIRKLVGQIYGVQTQ